MTNRDMANTADRDTTDAGAAGGPAGDQTPRTALVFPGQGAQKAGMGQAWQDTASWAVVAEISEHTGIDVEELLLKADDETLRRTDLAQIAVFTTEVMAHREARAAGLLGEVVACAGHSLGEYTALYAAGAASLADTARLVAARGRAMRACAERSPGTMAAVVRLDPETVATLVAQVQGDGGQEEGGQVWIANVNAPGAIVVSGTAEAVDRLAERAVESEGKVIRLAVGGAFHSPLMAAAADELREALAAVQFAPEHTPVVANTDARPYATGEHWRDLELNQLTSPVRWEECVRTLAGELGCARFVELGPGRQLTGMIRRIVDGARTVPVESAAALAKLTTPEPR
ncbi:ACP S-malonyltransferase [Streptomyces luomodiensis]|uniref:Malonyl CoA-acyl carrier protein transacylase n=1 Tax=Streptomyces luomodiensis TaxID=3026192 RepID=A0ABY9UW46_9ACTN|nr:ACP S-malonyltransferase [Streptomyces sp. SCA4-21]WNE96786.1 ACP S-malonyltransferase [Streptomyces sp. SCA4-21]